MKYPSDTLLSGPCDKKRPNVGLQVVWKTKRGTNNISFRGYSCVVSWSDWNSNITTLKCISSAEARAVTLRGGNVVQWRQAVSLCFICLGTRGPTFGRSHLSGMHEKEFFTVCTALNGECVAMCGGSPVVRARSVTSELAFTRWPNQ